LKHPWFDLERCDETFFDSAPVRYADAMDLPVAAERVWEGLTADRPLAWCRALSSARWTSPRPFGVGTTRTVASLGALVLRERFFRWEEGRRKSFLVLQTSVPMFRRFAEDYLVEETSQSGCRFTWTIAAEPRLAGRLAAPVNALLIRSLFKDTRRHFGAR
jgi:hypothetical protein